MGNYISKFKVGDVVICKPGYKCNDDDKVGGGHGYKEGKQITIKSVSNHNDGAVLWPVGNGNGIQERAVELVNNQEQYEIY